jgi:hypothetical protein
MLAVCSACREEPAEEVPFMATGMSLDVALQKADTIVSGRLLKVALGHEQRRVPVDGGSVPMVARLAILTVAVEFPILMYREANNVRVAVWLDQNDASRFEIEGRYIFLLNRLQKPETGAGNETFWAESGSNIIELESEFTEVGLMRLAIRRKLVSILLPDDCESQPQGDFNARAARAIQIGGLQGTYPLLKRRLSCAEPRARLNACVVLFNNYFMGQRNCGSMAATVEGFSDLPEDDRKRMTNRGEEDQRFRTLFLKEPTTVARQISALQGDEGLADVFAFLLQHPDPGVATVARMSLAKMGQR